MRRYFASEPRHSREELERQAQEAIDARINLGRPPDEEFQHLEQRLADVDRAESARQAAERIPVAEPIRIHEVRVPPAGEQTAEEEPAASSRATATRQPVTARTSAN